MIFTKDGIDKITNAAGAIIGLPDILEGGVRVAAGDYVGGGLLVAKGLAELIGFYFIGK